jgi:hypothetical protein
VKYLSLIIFSILFLIGCKSTNNITTASNSVKNLTLDEFCQSNDCRKNTHIKFNTNEGAVDQILPLYWPAAQYDKISILPGDHLFIEADVIDGKLLANFKLVSEITHPDKTIHLYFKQMESSLGMMLYVKNPFAKSIKYHINMIDFSGKPHRTSSCPITENLSVYESWPHPIPELSLTNMHFMDVDDETICIY